MHNFLTFSSRTALATAAVMLILPAEAWAQDGTTAAMAARTTVTDPGIAASPTTNLPSSNVRTTARSTVTSDTVGSVQDIIVTAQRRSERLSDVGISITAVPAARLQSAGVTDVRGLANVVPGLTFSETFSTFPVFSLRGVNFNAAQLSAPPAVSVSLDEASLPYSAMTGGIFLDVDHVEVLKGPQGTLYGENSTGGSINVVTAKPTDDLHMGARTEVNNFGGVIAEGYVSGPISDTLKARLSLMTDEGGAWQKGYYLNRRKNGNANKYLGRLILEWRPTDKLSASLNINGYDDKGEAQQPQLATIAPVVPSAADPVLQTYPLPKNDRDSDIDRGFDTHTRNSQEQAVGRLDYKANSDLTITSITNYVRNRYFVPSNADGTALPIITNASYSGNINTIEQELRLAGTVFAEKVRYIVGGNYEHSSVGDDSFTQYPDYSALPTNAQLSGRFRQTNRSAAVFGNVEYAITGRLKLIGGVRYTNSKQAITGCTKDGGNGIAASVLQAIANGQRAAHGLALTDAYAAGQCISINDVGPNATFLPTSVSLSQKQDNVSWRAGLNFKPTRNSLIYGTISRGFKEGVFPVQITLVASQVRPARQEELTSFEVGYKTDFLDHRGHFNAAFFYYQYNDKQFYTFVPAVIGGAVSTIVNIPHSHEKGLDADITFSPVDGLTLRGAVTYIDTRIGRFTGFGLLGQAQDFTGNEFNFAPPVSASLGVEYRQPLAQGFTGFVSADGIYEDRTYSDLFASSTVRIPSYTLINMRVGIDGSGSRNWSVSAFVRNLTNKYYWNSVNPAGDNYNKYSGLPRTFGISASLKI